MGVGKAGRIRFDEKGTSLLMCQSSRKSMYKRLLFEPFTLESNLATNLQDNFNAEIVKETIEGKQDAVDYLTWTFYYRRIFSNPNYYNVTGNSNEHVSSHSSELVETTLDALARSGLIIIEENGIDVKPANLGRIAAYYSVRYTTIEIFKTSLKVEKSQKELIEVLCSSYEFENVVVNSGDESIIETILSYKTTSKEIHRLIDPHIKTKALVYAHFYRVQVRGDLLIEQRAILLVCTKLI